MNEGYPVFMISHCQNVLATYFALQTLMVQHVLLLKQWEYTKQ